MLYNISSLYEKDNAIAKEQSTPLTCLSCLHLFSCTRRKLIVCSRLHHWGQLWGVAFQSCDFNYTQSARWLKVILKMCTKAFRQKTRELWISNTRMICEMRKKKYTGSLGNAIPRICEFGSRCTCWARSCLGLLSYTRAATPSDHYHHLHSGESAGVVHGGSVSSNFHNLRAGVARIVPIQ